LDPSDLSHPEAVLDVLVELLDLDRGEYVEDEDIGDERCYLLYGSDQDRLVEVAQAAVARFSLSSTCAVKTVSGREETGEGERIAL
jgi:hypothetical protein